MKYGRIYFEDVQVGDALPPLVKGPIQQIQLTRYAGASLDFNPIHQDDEFARAAGMGGVFAHGMLSMGFVAQALTDWAGAGSVRKPKPHHLRLWYALADLYERAGDLPRARTLFRRVQRHDAEFADVAERLKSLG